MRKRVWKVRGERVWRMKLEGVWREGAEGDERDRRTLYRQTKTSPNSKGRRQQHRRTQVLRGGHPGVIRLRYDCNSLKERLGWNVRLLLGVCFRDS